LSAGGIGVFELWREDIQVVKDRDPACRSTWEVLLCYPGFRAVRSHRLAHALWQGRFRLLARWLSERSRRRTGIEIHPAAVIGRRVFIDHGSGVVIGETAEVGDDVTMYQGVTLGGTGKEKGKRHPTIRSHVMISTGAKVLGAIEVGEGAKIGAGAVVVHPVPAHATVVGVPGRVVRRHGQPVHEEEDLEHGNLPDPVQEKLAEISRDVAKLAVRLATLERRKGASNVDQSA